MTLDQLAALHFDGAANITSDNDQGTALRQLLNKLIELQKTWFKAIASPFTTGGAGAWQDVTGLSQSVTPTYDAVRINVTASLEVEGAGAGALNARIVIGSDNGATQTLDVDSTGSETISLQHSFQGVKGTAYTVKVQMQDDASVAFTANEASMQISLGAVQS